MLELYAAFIRRAIFCCANQFIAATLLIMLIPYTGNRNLAVASRKHYIMVLPVPAK